ncbi:MAG: hypothetical protein JSV90_07425 [Methanobacteriota archaeon]|nr:MAG: hypothetical protein JSV90_07425 [Euryarchaeota archaeon]
MAPRKTKTKSPAPEHREEAKAPEDFNRRLERAEAPRARKAAMLQLRMGRVAHVLGLASGLALAATAVLAYLLENWELLIDAPEYVTVLKWIVPLMAGVIAALVALGVKWEPYFADRREPHFALNVAAFIVPAVFIALIALDEMGEVALGRPDWLYPASLLGITLTMISLALTWEGRGRRKAISIAAAMFPPSLLVFPMVFHFAPIDLASILPMAYLGSAVAVQLSGSMLHIIASSTSIQEREVLKASDGKLREQIKELERRAVALDYREEAFRTKESDLEAYERRLSEELEVIDDRKMHIEKMESELELRAQDAKSARQELTKKEVEIETQLDTLRLKETDTETQKREVDKRVKSVTSKEMKLAKKGSELEQKLLEATAKERDLKRQIADIAEERKSFESVRAELETLQAELAEKEKQLAKRETTVDVGMLQSLAAKKGAGKGDEATAVESLRQQLLISKEAVAEKEIALRTREEEIRKKAQKAERLVARADKQMNDLVEKESQLLEREKEIAQTEAGLRTAMDSLEAQGEEIRLTKEDAMEAEKQYAALAKSLRDKLGEANEQKEELSRKRMSLERREGIVKELEARLKAEHERANAKVRELIAKDKSLNAKETELGLKLAELKSKERSLFKSVTDFDSARSGVVEADAEGMKALDVRERRLKDKEREMKARLYQREKELEKRERALQTQLKKDIDDLGAEVETEYADKKVKTGIERLDDLLLGGMPFAANVLYVGPPFIGKETATMLFVAEGLKKGVPAVIVTTSHPPVEVARMMAPIMPTFVEFEQLGLVRWIDATGSPDESRSGDGTGNVTKVDGPDDYKGIGSAMDDIASSLSGDGHPYFRVVYLSLSMSVPEADNKAAYRFVQAFATRVRQSNAVGVYTLEKGMHSEQQIESIQHQMTGAVEFKTDKKKTLLSVQGICDAQTRDWVEYRHTNKSLTIGAFSLERIR